MGKNVDVKELKVEDRSRFTRAMGDIDGEGMHTVLGQDPSKAYFLAAKANTHPNSVQRMKDLGFEVVNAENNKGESMPRGVVQTTDGGAIQTPELVLMSIDKAISEYRRKYFDDLAISRREENDERLEELKDRATSTQRKYFVMGS